VIGDPQSLITRLCAIVDVEVATRGRWEPLDIARAFLNGGARFVQLRAKHLSSGELLDLAEAIVAIAHAAGATVIVNDRADLARLAGADGVHVGQEDLPPSAARAIAGERALVGLSTHTPAQLDAAAGELIDYVAIGPVFGSATKATGYEAVGLDMVRRAARVGPPVVGIGGITLDNARAVIEAGASSVAVIGDLVAGGDPERRVREYVRALE
jgi:thiamine-phosphate pyrophosphorylase